MPGLTREATAKESCGSESQPACTTVSLAMSPGKREGTANKLPLLLKLGGLTSQGLEFGNLQTSQVLHLVSEIPNSSLYLQGKAQWLEHSRHPVHFEGMDG